ncbi:MAG: (d)CMP kinase [Rickettsiales bacterium]|nr:(d)CMP kinase [Rickettsiales bacterium]
MGKNSQVERIVIAIDGVSASGKTKLTTELAKHYNLPYLLTGNLYRTLALKLLQHDLSALTANELATSIASIKTEDLESDDLKSDIISVSASKIAKDPLVRELLSQYQKDWIALHKMSIVEGRDIGTVIYPKAQIKLFITASPEIRAKRRWQELIETKSDTHYQSVLENLKNRDSEDQNRKIAPLQQANDAVVIDTTDKTVENMIDTAIKIIEKKIDNIPYTV